MVILYSELFCQGIDSLNNPKLFPFIVDSIYIQGNEITEDYIIMRELTFGVGDTLTQTLLFYNRERIYSLGIFNHVYLIPNVVEGKNILTIELEEGWYLYPIPFIDVKERDLKKLSFGLYLKLKNFRGRNEELSAAFAFGYDPAFYLNFFSPSIIGKENIFFRTRVGFSDISNKSPSAQVLYEEPFSQKIIYAQLVLGKRLGLYQKLYFTGGFNYLETPKYIEGINGSNNRIDNIVDAGVGYEYDTRDLAQFPKNGIYTSANLVFRGLGVDDINYRVLAINFREYRNLFNKLVSKWKFASRMTFGENIPFYDQSIIGVEEKIRGHMYEKYEGNDIYTGFVELFYPIVEELNLDLSFIPIIPDKLLSYRLGFYTQVFAETGIAKYKYQPFALNRFVSGYGFGITFLILPHQVLRFEVGFNEKAKAELIFDLGISF
jgi:outer membrane protein assembly factor BamA